MRSLCEALKCRMFCIFLPSPWCHIHLDSFFFRWTFPCITQYYCYWWHRRMWLWSFEERPSMANLQVFVCRLQNRNNLAKHKRQDRMVVLCLDQIQRLSKNSKLTKFNADKWKQKYVNMNIHGFTLLPPPAEPKPPFNKSSTFSKKEMWYNILFVTSKVKSKSINQHHQFLHFLQSLHSRLRNLFLPVD